MNNNPINENNNNNYKSLIIIVILIVFIPLIYYIFKQFRQVIFKDNENQISNYSNNNNIAVTDSASNIVSENTIQEDSVSSNTIVSQPKMTDFYVLFNGFYLQKKIGIQRLKSFKEKDKKDYEKTYYNYTNNKYTGKTKGILEENLEDFYLISNVGKIATSQYYNAIPRAITTLNKMPNNFFEKNPSFLNCTTLESLKVDLDGDNKSEFIIISTYQKAKEDTNNNIPIASSKISLFDNNYTLVNTMLLLNNGHLILPSGEIKENDPNFLSIQNVSLVDIDNDEIIEIILEIPAYEFSDKISIVKYYNGVYEGEKNIESSVQF